MIIKNVTGFMLGCPGHCVYKGEQWLSYDSPVYVCQTIDVAKKILQGSQIVPVLNGGPVWDTIYRVTAKQLNCTKIKDGLLFVTNPTNIIVDSVVAYNPPHKITEAELLRNATTILPHISRLINSSTKERGKC